MQTKIVSLADELYVVLPDEIISALQLQEGDDLAIRMVGDREIEIAKGTDGVIDARGA